VKEKPVIEGLRLDRGMSMLSRWRAKRGGAATFIRLADEPRDRRRERRRITHLKWGKALDCADRFLCECVMCNRTTGGACLRLARNIVLPTKFQLFDDDSGAIFDAQVVWRRGGEIGCRLSLSPNSDKTRLARRMRQRYYAL